MFAEASMSAHATAEPKDADADPQQPQVSLRCPKYWLMNHVHFCLTEWGCVLLDLERDRYFGLTEKQAGALALAVEGWPTTHIPAGMHISADEANAVALELASAGLLTHERRSGKTARPAELTDANMLIHVGEGSLAGALRAQDVGNFAQAYAKALWQMKCRPLKAIVNAVCSRKQSAGSRFDLEQATSLTNTFAKLRPYVFTSREHCLFHALTLVHFLAQHDVYPFLVIGVRTRPFRAHSWVQQGQYVFDCTPEEVCFYTPILAA